jgi:hypothetical protein
LFFKEIGNEGQPEIHKASSSKFCERICSECPQSMRDPIARTTNWHLRDHSPRPAPRATRGGSHRRQPHPALRRVRRACSISTSQERTSHLRGGFRTEA